MGLIQAYRRLKTGSIASLRSRLEKGSESQKACVTCLASSDQELLGSCL
jgi:hypothetical protein